MGSNNVTVVRERDGSFKMSFISGSVINVPGEPGARIISPPCGDGKSTMIKKIMSEYFPYGVLVSVGTIEEAEDYANYVRENIVGKESFGVRMTNERLIVLHSGNEDKHAEYIYSSNPVEIMDKYIVICTHHKLLNNDPRILVQVNKEKFPIAREEEDTRIKGYNYGGFRALKAFGCFDFYYGSIRIIGPDGIPRRQFILVDEMPKCPSIRWKVKRKDIFTLLSPFMRTIDNCTYNKVSIPRNDGTMCELDVVSEYRPNLYIVGYPNSLDKVMDSYNSMIRGSETDPIAGTRGINEINRVFLIESFVMTICKYYGNILNTPISMNQIPEEMDVCYNLPTLISGSISTRVWVFDGTGDLSFYGIKGFDLYVPGNMDSPKYLSDISFRRIATSFIRRMDEGTLFARTDKLIGMMTETVSSLMSCFYASPNSKFLIVTWKTLNFRKNSSERSSSGPLEDYVITGDKGSKIDLVRYLKEFLGYSVEAAKSSGYLSPSFEFDVIHYQSGLDRATNKYRSYDSIIFLGKFRVPHSAIIEHNLLTGANTDIVRFTIQSLVQAICRTRIRNHQGEPINVYFSSDWDDRLVSLVRLYMSNKPNPNRMRLVFPSMKMSESDLMSEDFISSVNESLDRNYSGTGLIETKLNCVSNSWRRKLGILLQNYPDIEMSILSGRGGSFDIPLDDLYCMIPMSKKERSRYSGLIRVLNELGVTLRIT